MLGLVLAESFFFIYIFWELVGLASYLPLIGFAPSVVVAVLFGRFFGFRQPGGNLIRAGLIGCSQHG